MIIIRSIAGSDAIYAQVGGRYWHVATPADLEAYRTAAKTAGVPVLQLQVSAAEHANLLAAAA